MAGASFTEEKNAAICNGREFKAKWGVSKTKDKITDFDNIENDRYFAKRCIERNNPKLMEGRTQISIIPKIKRMCWWIEQKIYQELEIWTPIIQQRLPEISWCQKWH